MITLKAVQILLRARFLIARNTFWRGKLRRKLGIVMLLALAGFAAWGLYRFSSFVVRAINSPQFAEALRTAARDIPNLPADITPVLQAIPSIALFGALILLIFSSFSSVLSSLYLSGDMDMLLVTPVPMRAVFIVKFFGGLLTQYVLLFALLAPALLGYGQGMGYGWGYILMALLTLLLLPLLPAGLGALLVMVIVRVIPARRARDIVSILGGLLGVSFYVVSQFAPEVAPRIANVRSVGALLQLDLPLLPSAWAGRALVAAGEGTLLTLLAYGGPFILLSLVTFAICLMLAERLYYSGWSNMAVQGGRVRASRRQRTGGSEPALAGTQSLVVRLFAFILPAQSHAVFYKDWRIFPRDLRNLQQLIFPLALAGIWTFRLLTGTQAATDLPPAFDAGGGTRSLEGLGSAGIAFFLCLTIANTIAGPGISREGRAFWLLKLAPISPLRILLGKLALAYLPFPTIGTLFLVLLAVLRQASPADFLVGWALLLLIGLGSTCISLGLGATFPKLDWENPQQQTTLQAGCLSFIIYTLYIILVIAAALGLPALGSILIANLGAAPDLRITLTVLGWGLALALTTLAVWGGLRAGSRGIERIEV